MDYCKNLYNDVWSWIIETNKTKANYILTLRLYSYELSRYGARTCCKRASLVVTVTRGHRGQLNVFWDKVTDAALAVRGNGESLPGARLLGILGSGIPL